MLVTSLNSCIDKMSVIGYIETYAIVLVLGVFGLDRAVGAGNAPPPDTVPGSAPLTMSETRINCQGKEFAGLRGTLLVSRG